MAAAVAITILKGEHHTDTDFRIEIPNRKYLKSDMVVQILLNG